MRLAELDVIDNSVTGGVQTTEHPVESKILDAVAILEVLERLSEGLKKYH